MINSLNQNLITMTPAVKQTLNSAEEVCFAADIGGRAALVIKASESNVNHWRGAGRPIAYRYATGYYPTGAVISLAVTVFADDGRAVTAVTMLNVNSKHDFPLLLKFACQDRLYLHLFGDQARFKFSKWVRHGRQHSKRLTALIRGARSHNAHCDTLDWQRSVTSFVAIADQG